LCYHSLHQHAATIFGNFVHTFDVKQHKHYGTWNVPERGDETATAWPFRSCPDLEPPPKQLPEPPMPKVPCPSKGLCETSSNPCSSLRGEDEIGPPTASSCLFQDWPKTNSHYSNKFSKNLEKRMEIAGFDKNLADGRRGSLPRAPKKNADSRSSELLPLPLSPSFLPRAPRWHGRRTAPHRRRLAENRPTGSRGRKGRRSRRPWPGVFTRSAVPRPAGSAVAVPPSPPPRFCGDARGQIARRPAPTPRARKKVHVFYRRRRGPARAPTPATPARSIGQRHSPEIESPSGRLRPRPGNSVKWAARAADRSAPRFRVPDGRLGWAAPVPAIRAGPLPGGDA
jgi:hypothetical protein